MRKTMSRKQAWVILGVLAAVLVAGFMFVDERGAGGAKSKCEEVVADALRSPSTAEFSDTTASEEDDGRWRVTGAVDSENGFGAMIRTQYVCEVTRANGWWQVMSVDFPE